MQENKPDKAKAVLDSLLEKFQSGELSKIIARRVIEAPEGSQPRPCDGWSLSNNLLLWIQGTSDARGFNQWKEVGRHVKKGAKAVSILAPKIIKDKEANDGEGGEKCIGFRSIPVFAVEDTEGEALPEVQTPPPPPLLEVARAWNITVSYANAFGGKLGEFSVSGFSGREKIMLASPDEAVFFHELAHAAHHRLGKLEGADKAAREGVAEFAATVLSQMYLGVDLSGNCMDYLAGYSKNPARLAVQVAEETVEVLRLILSHQAEEQKEAA